MMDLIHLYKQLLLIFEQAKLKTCPCVIKRCTFDYLFLSYCRLFVMIFQSYLPLLANNCISVQYLISNVNKYCSLQYHAPIDWI